MRSLGASESQKPAKMVSANSIVIPSAARDLLSSAEHQSLLAGIPALDEDGENTHYVCDEVTLRTNDLALRSQAAISEEAALHVAL